MRRTLKRYRPKAICPICHAGLDEELTPLELLRVKGLPDDTRLRRVRCRCSAWYWVKAKDIASAVEIIDRRAA